MSPNPPELNTASRAIATEPRWLPLERYTSANLPAATRRWLMDEGSLTDRLIASGRGPFSVRRLAQNWEAPLASERELLEIPQGQQALVREVALSLGTVVVVFARSVFPEQSLTGELEYLRSLENESLGAILFSNPAMQRRPFELAHMPGDSDYLPQHLKQSAPAWGRRSRFDISGKPLMVSEVFLETFQPWTEDTSASGA